MERQASNPSHSSSRDPILETFRILQEVVVIAILLATVYTAWSPSGLFNGSFEEQFPNLFGQEAQQPGLSADNPQTPRPRLVGIIAGHWGNDSGAVCPDGLREVDVNLDIATRVQSSLEAKGIKTELLKEKDPRLSGYNATLLISIHNDSCDYFSDAHTGFKVAGNDGENGNAPRLISCLNTRYAARTQLPRHGTTITSDMTGYHAFDPDSPDTINPGTAAAIIETGFLNLDRQMLTEHPDVIAQGVVDGIMCFLNYESIDPTPLASPAGPQVNTPQP